MRCESVTAPILDRKRLPSTFAPLGATAIWESFIDFPNVGKSNLNFRHSVRMLPPEAGGFPPLDNEAPTCVLHHRKRISSRARLPNTCARRNQPSRRSD